uniref:Uncharacterized protein n=1 Tax=Branchiostoma floridae TaxID=7739 RepID=C3YB91_BRAFL|eukprot:XP_002606238.1 hypothetical protein BRAFLDRAFT_84021 [Branchiostoma floridae]
MLAAAQKVSEEQPIAENSVLISDTLYWPKPPTAMVISNRLWTGLPITEAKETTFSLDNPTASYFVECNVFLDDDVEQCDYSEPRSGVSWACVKPKTLPCSSRVDHKVDYDLSNHLNKLCFPLSSEQRHMISSLVTYDEEKGGTFKKTINGSPDSINVKSTSVPITVSLRRPRCEAGIPAPTAPTTGFWQRDVWTSTVCHNRHFPRREHYYKCLKNKELYFMGDSTGRQLYEFLVFSILNTTFSAADPSITRRAGPHYAVHTPSNLTLRFRVHGPPLRTGGINVTHINYLANEINSVRGGSDYVIIITMWAHFTSFHYDIYIKRLRGIRTAILNLLHRKPDTLIVFKTASTRTGVPRNIVRQYRLQSTDHQGIEVVLQMTNAYVQVLTLLVSWCACAAQQFGGDPSVCQPCTPPCVTLPGIPQSFEAKIEVNNQNGNETYDVEEHFDGLNNRAVVYMTRQGRTGKQILNFNGGEVYNILGTQCVAEPIDAGEDLFGYIPAPNGTHIFSSVVFQTASGDPVIPVRVTVGGKGRAPNTNSGGPRREFFRTYEYMYFRSSLRADSSVFETPRGVECHNRQSQETFPSIPQHMHYVEEQILPQTKMVNGLEAWYNYDQQLLRLDYLAPSDTFVPLEGRFGVPKRVIHDFSTGLEYETDLRTGACSVRRIVDSVLQLNDNNNGIMLTPAQTEHLDTVQKYYMGKHTIRNIPADGWIYRRQVNISSELVWLEQQLYFSSLPVSTNYTGPRESVIKVHNFDMDQDITDFAVSNCYFANQKQVIRFQFPVTVSSLLKLYGWKLILQTKIQVCRAVGISFLRCEDVMYDNDEAATYVTMAVLDAPPVGMTPRDHPLTPTVDAVMLLQQKIDSNQLIITLSRDVQITAIPGSLQHNVYTPPSNIVCRPNKAKRDASTTGCNGELLGTVQGHSSGTLAGVAVALLVAGVLLGLTVQYAIVRRGMKSAEAAGLTSRMEMPDITSLPAAIPD